MSKEHGKRTRELKQPSNGRENAKEKENLSKRRKNVKQDDEFEVVESDTFSCFVQKLRNGA